ncbi:MAG: hypothetical protein QXL15_01935, partial [Candidatus Korarchaeota archaeon]
MYKKYLVLISLVVILGACAFVPPFANVSSQGISKDYISGKLHSVNGYTGKSNATSDIIVNRSLYDSEWNATEFSLLLFNISTSYIYHENIDAENTHKLSSSEELYRAFSIPATCFLKSIEVKLHSAFGSENVIIRIYPATLDGDIKPDTSRILFTTTFKVNSSHYYYTVSVNATLN